MSSLGSIVALLHASSALVQQIVASYGYLGIFGLMLLESASLPIPSEVIMPLAGYYSSIGVLDPFAAMAVALIGSVIGMAVDYYVAYFVGKEVVYKHLGAFHISKERLDAFDRWFKVNGPAAVMIVRLIPVIRGLVSFPAGFAEMPVRKFFLYSFIGAFIWDLVLFMLGFYALSYALQENNVYLLFIIIAAVAVVMYLVYYFAMKRMNRSEQNAKEQ